jgi:hypothetical protein
MLFAVSAVVIAVMSRNAGLQLLASECLWIAGTSVIPLSFAIYHCGAWSASGVFVIVFWIFHFGLLASIGVKSIAVDELSAWNQEWVSGPYATQAAWLAAASFLALLSGMSAIRAVRWTNIAEIAGHAPSRLDEFDSGLGSAVLISALVIWGAAVLLSGGSALLFGSYADYLQQTSGVDVVMALVWFAFGIGLVLTVAGTASRTRTVALAATTLFALVALPIGLRGELLFPALGATVAWARLNRRIPAARACIAALLVLLLIPVVREVRVFGLRSIRDVSFRPNVVEALVEMGASLHPVEKVVRWHAEGEPLLLGASYWAPFERGAARVFPQLRREDAENDERIMNVLVTARVGPIGFSPVAEAYRNFGKPGTLLLLGVIGIIIGSLDTIERERRAVIAIATVFLPLLINIRNSFVSVPAQCGLGLAVIIGASAARRMMRNAVTKQETKRGYRSGVLRVRDGLDER